MNNEALARTRYHEYVNSGLKMFPPFKGYGIKFLQFAADEPEMYKELFFKESSMNYIEYLDREIEWEKVIPSIQATLELNENDAKWLFRNMLIYVMGIAAMYSTGACEFSQQEISTNLGTVCRALLLQVKNPGDERSKISPKEGGIDDYLRTRKNFIIGYGPEKEIYQVKLDAILYFEAVGENVFAYTKSNVYEIKQRLYKVEEFVKDFSFVRASKSLLVNLSCVNSIAPSDGGRGKITMTNGETVIASRGYMKSVVTSLKQPAA